MRRQIRLASQVLALAASLLATLSPPATAAPSVGEVADASWVTRPADGACAARDEGTLLDLGEAVENACRISNGDPGRRISDDRAALTVVLTPQFHGPRGF
ncbi:MAG TPA: hypothetical protein VMV18_04835, partial [bacterium]|nr:hypothetical protein [bacterium]